MTPRADYYSSPAHSSSHLIQFFPFAAARFSPAFPFSPHPPHQTKHPTLPSTSTTPPLHPKCSPEAPSHGALPNAFSRPPSAAPSLPPPPPLIPSITPSVKPPASRSHPEMTVVLQQTWPLSFVEVADTRPPPASPMPWKSLRSR